MVGAEQMQWLADEIALSANAGTLWQLIGQQTMVQDWYGPDFELAIDQEQNSTTSERWKLALENVTSSDCGLCTVDDSTLTAYYTEENIAELCFSPKNCTWQSYDPHQYNQQLYGIPQPVSTTEILGVRAWLAMARYHMSYYFDSWCAYTEERDEFITTLRLQENASPVVYAGDSHNAWAGVLSDSTTKEAVAAEFDVTSVSSPGFERSIPMFETEFVNAGFLAANEDMLYAQVRRRGPCMVPSSAFLIVIAAYSISHCLSFSVSHTLHCTARLVYHTCQPTSYRWRVLVTA
jgi:alkaline phosphatase D